MNNMTHGNRTKYHVSFAIILIACVCTVIQMYAIPMKNMLLMSLTNRVMGILWILITLVAFYFHGTERLMEIVAVIGIALLSLLYSLIDSTRGLVTSLTVFLNFCILPFMMVFFACNEIEEASKKLMLLTFFVLSLLFVGLSRSSIAYRLEGEYAVINIKELTMGYPNQNQAAIYLFVCAINMFVGAFYFKHVLLKALFAADFVYMVVLLEKTKCRTALILIAVFLILCVASKKLKGLVTVAVWFPLVFAVAAQLLYPYIKDVTIMGDTLLNGRETLFSKYFDNLAVDTFFLGDFRRFRFDNLHNAYIAIAATTGIFVLSFYMYMLRKHMLQNLRPEIEKGYEHAAFIGFICLVLYFSTEAAGAVGGTNYAFMNMSLFVYFSKPFAKKDMI